MYVLHTPSLEGLTTMNTPLESLTTMDTPLEGLSFVDMWSCNVCMVTHPLHLCMATPLSSCPSQLPKCPLSPEGPQAGTHVHSLLVW